MSREKGKHRRLEGIKISANQSNLLSQKFRNADLSTDLKDKHNSSSFLGYPFVIFQVDRQDHIKSFT